MLETSYIEVPDIRVARTRANAVITVAGAAGWLLPPYVRKGFSSVPSVFVETKEVYAQIGFNGRSLHSYDGK